MSYPTKRDATRVSIAAAALILSGPVTACGLNGGLDAIAEPAVAAPVAASPVASTTSVDEMTPEAWAFVDAWWTAEQWDAAAGFARAVATYVYALRAAQAGQYHPPVVYTAPHVAVAPAPVRGSSSSPGGFFACVRNRESGNNYSAVNRSSGAGGAYQFMPSTWRGLGYSGLPQNAPAWLQDEAAQKLFSMSGKTPWNGGQWPC